MDADTVLEPDALNRAVLPFLEDPRTIGVGAAVAMTNGCLIEDGRITDAALPGSWFARFQIVGTCAPSSCSAWPAPPRTAC